MRRRHGLAAGLGAALAMTAWAAAGGGGAERPIANAGFESARDGAPAGWRWWSRTKHGSAVQTRAVRHGGAAAAHLRHDGPRDWAFSSTTRLPARAGETYRVSAWVRTEAGPVTLAVVALGGEKTLSWDIGSAGTSVRGRWVNLDAPVRVPGGCDGIYVRFVGEGRTVAWVDDVALRRWTPPPPKPREKVRGWAFDRRRVVERLGRAPVAVPAGDGKVHVGWRMLADDPPDIAFHVGRRTGDGPFVRLTRQPVRRTTDFTDTAALVGTKCTYRIEAVVAGRTTPCAELAEVVPGAKARPYVSIPLAGKHTFQKAGIADLDGDGRYDFVLKQPGENIDPYVKYWKRSPDTYTLEAYRHDGTLLWRYDLGWAIERGIWYSPYVVWDLDGDGRAEVAVKTGEGDPRDADGRVQSGPEYVTILDGRTGRPVAQAAWPERALFPSYNYASRNQLGIAYLDGRTPCLIVERGTYNVIIVDAWELTGGKLRRLWRWDNRGLGRSWSGQGAHWMHCADIDADGRDEVLLGSATLDDDGSGLWTTGLGHPDHFYLGDLNPERPGLEIYFGMETRQKANGMCMVCARTGKILWGFASPTRHVHGSGLCSDLTAEQAGSECYSADTDPQKHFAYARLHDCTGREIGRANLGGFSPRAAWWDADLQREVIVGGRISDLENVGRAALARLAGRWVLTADILGDWREEVVMSLPGELRIYTTPLPAADRRPCLMQDALYRRDVAHAAMGYTQPALPGFDLAAAARAGRNR